MCCLTLEGKIIVFKTLAISKIVFLSLISKVPTEILIELERIQKTFLWLSKPKIEDETLSSDFKYGGLKNVNVQKKITNLQCSWVRRLYDDSFHEWKVITLKFNFLDSYIFGNWKRYFSTSPETLSSILQEFSPRF